MVLLLVSRKQESGDIEITVSAEEIIVLHRALRDEDGRTDIVVDDLATDVAKFWALLYREGAVADYLILLQEAERRIRAGEIDFEMEVKM